MLESVDTSGRPLGGHWRYTARVSAMGQKQTLVWVVGQLVLELHDEVLDRLS